MTYLSSSTTSLPYKTLWWQPPQHPEFLECLAAWLHRDAYPLDVFRQKIWEDPDFDAELCLVLGEAPEWLGFAMGVLRINQAGERQGVIKMVGLAPSQRGLGRGRALIAQLEARLFKRGAAFIRLGESAPNYLAPGLDPYYTRAWTVFEGLGYRAIGHTFNLKVPLRPAYPLDTAKTFVSRRAHRDDVATVRNFLKAHWPSWCGEVLPVFQSEPIPLFLAWADHQLLGFAAYECNNRGAGWFGPMGTAPHAQGQGIGRKLLYLVLEDMHAQGFREAIIPWVGPVRFYQRAAEASIHRIFFRMQKDRPKPEDVFEASSGA